MRARSHEAPTSFAHLGEETACLRDLVPPELPHAQHRLGLVVVGVRRCTRVRVRPEAPPRRIAGVEALLRDAEVRAVHRIDAPPTIVPVRKPMLLDETTRSTTAGDVAWVVALLEIGRRATRSRSSTSTLMPAVASRIAGSNSRSPSRHRSHRSVRPPQPPRNTRPLGHELGDDTCAHTPHSASSSLRKRDRRPRTNAMPHNVYGRRSILVVFATALASCAPDPAPAPDAGEPRSTLGSTRARRWARR